MSLQVYMPNGQTVEEYIAQQVALQVAEAVVATLRETWQWDYRNFPPYGDGVLPFNLREK